MYYFRGVSASCVLLLGTLLIICEGRSCIEFFSGGGGDRGSDISRPRLITWQARELLRQGKKVLYLYLSSAITTMYV